MARCLVPSFRRTHRRKNKFTAKSPSSRSAQDLAGECERPAGLGRLELTVTPAGPLDKAAVDRYAELGVDRLVLLPQPDATPAGRHAFVPVDGILRNIDTVAQQILGS